MCGGVKQFTMTPIKSVKKSFRLGRISSRCVEELCKGVVKVRFQQATKLHLDSGTGEEVASV